MRVLVVLLPFFVGASLANNFLKKLMPVDFDNEDCIDGACFIRNQMISIDRSKTDPTTNLAYNEMSLAYVNTQNLLAACLPNVDTVSVAKSFETCTGKQMKGVCVFSNRGWLIKDSQNETVANLAFLKKAFSGLAGGDDAVKKCLKIKEEEEVYDDDYFYEYAYDDYDYYDYLEEGEVMEVRRKREAGKEGSKKGSGKKGTGKKGKDGKKGEGKKKERKGKGRNSKKTGGKKGGKKVGRKGKGRNNKKGENKGKGKNGKQTDGGNEGKTSGKKGNGKKGNGNNRNGGKKGKGNGEKGGKPHAKKGNGNKGNKENKENSQERKFVKTDDETPSAKNEAKVNAKLKKLGFSKMPTKSTLKGLECIWDNLELLLIKCGEKIISESP